MFEKTSTGPDATLTGLDTISTLAKETRISNDPSKPDIYIVYENQIRISDYANTHSQVARKSGAHYPEVSPSNSGLKVDDAGEIFDDGTNLIIPDSFPNDVMVKAWFKAVVANENILEQVNKETRQKTAQRIANRTGRSVIVQHEDGTQDQFSPIR